MTPEDVKKYYKTTYGFMKSTGMAHVSLLNWLKKGIVPEASQYKLERLTHGELKTEWSNKE